MDNIEVIALLGLTLVTHKIINNMNKRRRIWSRRWLAARNDRHGNGVLSMIRNEVVNEDPNSYKNYLRMDNESFKCLLRIIAPKITKQDTILRQSISAEDRLMATLRYWMEALRSLTFSTRIAHNTLSVIIHEVLLAICKSLEAEYLKVPQTEKEWQLIANDFGRYWNFPNCIGALDGKHITFRPLRCDGSFYRNYKGTDSIVLLAVVDAKYRFLIVDIGQNGRMSDGGVFMRSALAYALNNRTLNLPAPKCLPGRTNKVPFVLVADDAFPLKHNIMKPFKVAGLSDAQRIFDYRLCRARRIVENAFGILSNRFRILSNTMNVKVDKVELITKTCCILHNYLITNSARYRCSIEEDDQINCPLQNVIHQGGNRTAREPQQIRLEFLEYFSTTGAVPWQQHVVNNNIM